MRVIISRGKTVVLCLSGLLYLHTNAFADYLWAQQNALPYTVYRIDPSTGTATAMWGLPGNSSYGGLEQPCDWGRISQLNNYRPLPDGRDRGRCSNLLNWEI